MMCPAESNASSVTRLKKRAEFLRVARRGRKWAAPGVVLQSFRRSGDGPEAAAVRVGFTVTRKVGNAVIRNRARRRLKAAAGEILAEHGVGGVDYVLIGRAGTLKRPYPRLIGDIEAAMRKLKAYRP